eukprot:m.443286 g.443286  ORF g.443286 m.443286 type:complete len:126 (+) comp56822_c0_seq1:1-378(+)
MKFLAPSRLLPCLLLFCFGFFRFWMSCSVVRSLFFDGRFSSHSGFCGAQSIAHVRAKGYTEKARRMADVLLGELKIDVGQKVEELCDESDRRTSNWGLGSVRAVVSLAALWSPLLLVVAVAHRSA